MRASSRGRALVAALLIANKSPAGSTNVLERSSGRLRPIPKPGEAEVP